MRQVAFPMLGLAVLAAIPATAQTGNDVTVRAQRLPAAEAPRSATCEMMTLDPRFTAVMRTATERGVLGPQIFLPTRMPRNPSYGAAPSAAIKSALPNLSSTRFGVANNVFADEPGTGLAESEASIDGATGRDASETTRSSREQAIDACRAMFGTSRGRAAIAQNDDTLPMAFALFDQGRYGEAVDWFHKAERKLPFRDGGDEATLFLGKLYLQGLGDRSNPAEGVKWLKKAALAPFNSINETPVFDPARPELNTAVGEASVMLGNVYRRGFGGIARDTAQACRWYERAYEVGHVAAAKTLGDIYLAGEGGVPRDPVKAVRYYRKAAEYDLPSAQVALAEMIEQGDAGVKVEGTALDWYRAAARHNHPAALFALARAYDAGRGVPADQQRALGYYKAAALSGLPEAKVALGTYFHEGTAIPRDDRVARGWFEAAAKDNDVDGMFNLAAMLANGSGGPRDLPGALTWLKRAAAAGHTNAAAAAAKVQALMGNKG